MSEENKMEVVKAESSAPALSMPTVGDMIFDDAKFERMNALAEIMSKAVCAVPKHLQGKPGDCFAIIAQAAQWKMNPFVVAQKTHIVNGALGYEAQLVNAVITSMGVTSSRFNYEYVGDWDEYRKSGFKKEKECGCGVNVGAVLRGETEIRWLPMPLCMEQVKTRNSPLWITNPQQQLAYLAVKYWARLYAPDAILGVYSDDELAESVPPMQNVTPVEDKPQKGTAALKKAISKKKETIVDAEEVKPETFRDKFVAYLNVNGAPISEDDAVKFLRSKGALQNNQTLADFEQMPSEWREYCSNNMSDFVNQIFAARELI